ncbi:MAG: hypothetical protein ACRDYX_15630 [Egibacteraceae bacterium]
MFTFDIERALGRTRLLLLRHALRTLDALHLAIAEHEGQRLASGEPLVFVTRDQGQQDTAKALGDRQHGDPTHVGAPALRLTARFTAIHPAHRVTPIGAPAWATARSGALQAAPITFFPPHP